MSEIPTGHLFKDAESLTRYYQIYDAMIQMWPKKPESKMLDTPSGKTHCLKIEESEGPPLVVLHGGNSSSVIWGDCVAGLWEHYKIYCLDIMGDYGKSVPKGRMKSVQHLTTWLGECLDALKLKEASFLGFSYGGWIILNFVKDYPQRVRKASLLSPAASFKNLSMGFLLRAVWSMMRPTEAVLQSFYRFAGEPSVQGLDSYEKRMNSLVSLVLAGRRMKAQFVNPTVLKDEDLKTIQAPMQLMIGENEVIYDPVKSIERARSLLPSLETHLIPQASHDLVYSQPEVIVGHLTKFLGTSQPPPKQQLST